MVAVPFPLRTAIQGALKSGLVAVQFRKSGCGAELKVVEGCQVTVHYKWRSKPRARRIVLRNARELQARLSLSSSVLERRLAKSGGLLLDEKVAGMWLAPKGVVYDRSVLQGECGDATHVLTAVELGGYSVVSGPAANLKSVKKPFESAPSGDPKVAEISRVGDASACGASRRPRRGCDNPLSIRLKPLLKSGRAAKAPEMISYPAGYFTMGSDDGGRDEGPEHQVQLKAFSIDRTEVRSIEYERCVQEGKCKPAGEGVHCNRNKLDRGEHPINCVTHSDASAFCKWAGKRLPSEAEWARAARGEQGRVYPWGNEWPPAEGAGNFADSDGAELNTNWAQIEGYSDGHALTAPVASFTRYPSPGGMLDAAGNVAEWTADAYDAKAYRKKGRAARGNAKVVRGASFGHSRPEQIRLSRRAAYTQNTRSQHIGFRCAKDPQS